MSRNMILELDFFVLSPDNFDFQWIYNLLTLYLLDIWIDHVDPIKSIVDIMF